VMPPSFCAKIINLFPLYVEDLSWFWFDLLWCLLGAGNFILYNGGGRCGQLYLR